jgi:hypothetical protein
MVRYPHQRHQPVLEGLLVEAGEVEQLADSDSMLRDKAQQQRPHG